MRTRFKHPLLTIALAATMAATSARADEFSDKSKTIYMFGDYGLGTYKSLLVESNDTMGIVTYGFGASAGQDKNFGVEYRVENQSVTFALNQSSIATSWTSTIFKYRLWAIELGPVFGKAAVKANREGTDILDVVSSGYGGYFGMMLPIGKNSLLYLNGMSVANSDTVDREAREITLGSRTDVELGSRIGISRNAFDITLGYRRRTFSVTEASTAYNELQTSTFVGFHLGTDF
jgi:hypothetical protein